MFRFRQTVPGQLLVMWTCPRLILCTVLMAAVMVGVQWLFHRVVAIPHFLGFYPWVVLIPLAGIFWGPAGAWAAFIASILGDRVCDAWGPLTPWRAGGAFLFSLSAQQLWDFTLLQGVCGPLHRPRWGQSFRVLSSAAPGALAAAAWVALGSDWNRLYPFHYYFVLLAAEYVLFVGLLGVAFYRVMARELIPHLRSWRELLHLEDTEAILSLPRGLLIAVLGFAAPAAGLFLSAVVYRLPMLQPQILGMHTGPLLHGTVGGLLVLQALALFFPHRTRRAP